MVKNKIKRRHQSNLRYHGPTYMQKQNISSLQRNLRYHDFTYVLRKIKISFLQRIPRHHNPTYAKRTTNQSTHRRRKIISASTKQNSDHESNPFRSIFFSLFNTVDSRTFTVETPLRINFSTNNVDTLTVPDNATDDQN